MLRPAVYPPMGARIARRNRQDVERVHRSGNQVGLLLRRQWRRLRQRPWRDRRGGLPVGGGRYRSRHDDGIRPLRLLLLLRFLKGCLPGWRQGGGQVRQGLKRDVGRLALGPTVEDGVEPGPQAFGPMMDLGSRSRGGGHAQHLARNGGVVVECIRAMAMGHSMV